MLSISVLSDSDSIHRNTKIAGDTITFEAEPLESLAREGQLMARPHDGFWAAMDTLRDKNHLESLWASGQAPWRIWK